MWSFAFDESADRRVVRCIVQTGSRPACVHDVLRGWQADSEFRSLFNSALADSPFAVFRWETPAITRATLRRPFEFVLLDSPGLAQRPDSAPFQQHFARAKHDVVVFSNLGGDATLIVPCPSAEPVAYGHMGSFVRCAPESQRQALWQAVGNSLAERIGPKPVWLSTAGAGVAWLHVRLDDKPKYYGYRPYKQLP